MVARFRVGSDNLVASILEISAQPAIMSLNGHRSPFIA